MGGSYTHAAALVALTLRIAASDKLSDLTAAEMNCLDQWEKEIREDERRAFVNTWINDARAWNYTVGEWIQKTLNEVDAAVSLE